MSRWRAPRTLMAARLVLFHREHGRAEETEGEDEPDKQVHEQEAHACPPGHSRRTATRNRQKKSAGPVAALARRGVVRPPGAEGIRCRTLMGGGGGSWSRER